MSSVFIPELIDSQRVLYQCTCGQLKTIHRIYFCRYCNEIRCRDCVYHEVDSQFCQQCLEYIPSLDAKLKKNKCAQCYQCPSCHNILASRLQLVQTPHPTDPQQVATKKLSYYYCYFCRWTSRDIGLPDQTTSGSNFSEPEIPNAKRLDTLFEYYRILSHKEKNEKEKKKVNPRSAIFLLDKYGITSALSAKVTATLRARMARSSSGMSLSDKSFPELEDFKPSVALGEEEIEQMEKLNLQDYYGDADSSSEIEIDVSNRNSLAKIIHQVESQPSGCKNLFPTSQMLVVKRSLRCKKCEHNLSKPEYNPSLVKFKIQLSAYYHIPELRILRLPSLKLGTTTRVELTITNPTQYLLNVTLLPVDIHLNATADLVLPNTVLQLTPKDDTGDIVDFDSSASKFNDDSNVISFRQGNKLGIYLFVTPTKGDIDCVVEFRMKHDYVYTIPTPLSPHESADKQQPSKEVKWITHSIRVNLGNIAN